MAQSIVVKKEQKVNHIFDLIGIDCSFIEFAIKFKEEYPKDRGRINKVYLEHEKRDMKGKGHPMPAPDKYLENMYKVGKERYNKS